MDLLTLAEVAAMTRKQKHPALGRPCISRSGLLGSDPAARIDEKPSVSLAQRHAACARAAGRYAWHAIQGLCP